MKSSRDGTGLRRESLVSKLAVAERFLDSARNDIVFVPAWLTLLDICVICIV